LILNAVSRKIKIENDENIIFPIYINTIIYFNSKILKNFNFRMRDLTSTITNA